MFSLYVIGYVFIGATKFSNKFTGRYSVQMDSSHHYGLTIDSFTRC